MKELSDHSFKKADRDAVYQAIKLRRDIRHFLPDPIDQKVFHRLLLAFHQAPSVGLMQPWRVIRISDSKVKQQISEIVEIERQATAEALNARQDDFLKLKVEGIRECGELLVIALADEREGHIFGRRTMPDMDLASVACAIQNMWLAARAEGLGMGWVSMFDPITLAELLNIPNGAKPIAIICLGHVEEFYPAPMLELENWTEGMPLTDVMFENKWEGS